jgi:hypothetical protein
MTDYSELILLLRQTRASMLGTSDEDVYVNCQEAAYVIETQAKQIAELEHQMKVECDTFLWNRKRMSRHIAMLEYWMEKLFKFCSSPEARRNHMTMATEIPDYLIMEGEDILQHLEERSDLEKVDGII